MSTRTCSKCNKPMEKGNDYHVSNKDDVGYCMRSFVCTNRVHNNDVYLSNERLPCTESCRRKAAKK